MKDLSKDFWLGGLATAALALAPLPAAADAVAETLAPGDFATGRAIEAPGEAPLQTLLLDQLVYRGSVGSALADLRVFNAKGEAVPHAIRSLTTPREAADAPVTVPLFRLPEAGAGRPDAGPGLARSHGVEVEISGDGAVVRVAPVGGREGALPAPSSTYLVDLTRLPRRAVALELELGPEPAEFVTPMRVEASDDLVAFRTLRPRSALARLDQAGHRVERSDVEIGAPSGRYLLLSAPGRPLPEIRSARARLAPIEEPPPRDHARVAGAAIEQEPGAFVFDLGGQVPVDRVQVALPQANTVVRAELFSGASPDGPWTRHFAGIVYRLEPSLRNAELAVRSQRHRWFKLAVSPQGGGLGGGVPELEASWHPEQLLFVRRGDPPFALGYGRAGTERVRFSASELIALIRTAQNPEPVVPRATASLGEPYPVADASVLELRPEPVAGRTIALWGVLIVCVGSVLALSLRLLHQMRTADGPRPRS